MCKPIRVNKRQKPTNEDLKSREDYRIEKDFKCEICGKFTTEIHHKYPQQKIYWEHSENYFLLDRWDCHRLIESTKEQFIREVKISRNSEFYGWNKGDIYDHMKGNYRDIEL